jgi:hypothetical protein
MAYPRADPDSRILQIHRPLSITPSGMQDQYKNPIQ